LERLAAALTASIKADRIGIKRQRDRQTELHLLLQQLNRHLPSKIDGEKAH
jgi:hypothetical protein